MINFHPTFRQLLLTAVNNQKPVVYEVFRKEEDVPCISYIEINNSELFHGDTLSYSHVDYRVKIWAETISEIQEVATAIDTVLSENGFHRLASNEMLDEPYICKVMTYEALGKEY